MLRPYRPGESLEAGQTGGMTTPDWRPLVAALGNADARRVYARLVLGEADAFVGLSPSRAAHVRRMLEGAGLVDDTTVDERVFAQLLATPKARPTGVRRFLRADGRIDRYPSADADRRELHEHVAQRVVADGETLTEPELNERLAAFADDVAVLRRYLVDHELLERTRSGSSYGRVAG